MPPIVLVRNRHRTRRLAAIGAATALTAVALAATGAVPGARAASIVVDPLDAALDFNVFVEGDTTLSSTEMEGPLATGGNLIMQGGYNVAAHGTGTFTPGGDAQPSALVVGGRLDFDQSTSGSFVRVLNNGYAKVGDLAGTDVRNTDGNGASVNTRLVASGADYDGTPRIELTTQART